MPITSAGLTPIFVDERLRDAGRDDRRQRDREVAEAGLERGEPDHLLHVERKEEEHPEDRRAEQQPDHVRARHRPAAEEV